MFPSTFTSLQTCELWSSCGADAAAADGAPAGAAAVEAPCAAGPTADVGSGFKAQDEATGPGAARGAGARHEHPADAAQTANR